MPRTWVLKWDRDRSAAEKTPAPWQLIPQRWIIIIAVVVGLCTLLAPQFVGAIFFVLGWSVVIAWDSRVFLARHLVKRWGLDVDATDVALDFQRWRIIAHGVVLDNPDDLKGPAATAGSVVVTFTHGKPITISFELVDLTATILLITLTDSNLRRIVRNICGGEDDVASERDEDQSPPRFAVDKVCIRNGEVRLSSRHATFPPIFIPREEISCRDRKRRVLWVNQLLLRIVAATSANNAAGLYANVSDALDVAFSSLLEPTKARNNPCYLAIHGVLEGGKHAVAGAALTGLCIVDGVASGRLVAVDDVSLLGGVAAASTHAASGALRAAGATLKGVVDGAAAACDLARCGATRCGPAGAAVAGAAATVRRAVVGTGDLVVGMVDGAADAADAVGTRSLRDNIDHIKNASRRAKDLARHAFARARRPAHHRVRPTPTSRRSCRRDVACAPRPPPPRQRLRLADLLRSCCASKEPRTSLNNKGKHPSRDS